MSLIMNGEESLSNQKWNTIECVQLKKKLFHRGLA